MAEKSDVAVVQDAYAAFGRGDIDTLLALCTDDVEWEGIYGANEKVPHGGVRRGRDGVRTFFTTLAQHVEFQVFEPRTFLSGDGSVVALGTYQSTVKGTDRGYGGDWAMHFRVRDGRIAYFREYTNSAGVIAAFS